MNPGGFNMDKHMTSAILWPATGAGKIAKWATTLGFALTMMSCSAPDEATQRAQALLDKMTLEEKIGQVIQGDISTVTPADARDYNLGSVLNGGNSAPGGGKTASWQAWVDEADAYWQASTDTSDGGVGVPLLWGTDAVHGHNNLQMATIFPHNSALGATGDTDLLRRIGEVTALEVRGTGLDWVFAPTLAVAIDERWGRAYESYSDDPKLVSELGEAIIIGLQGKPGSDDYLGPRRVIATAKHFVGDGGTHMGVDKGDTKGSAKQIEDTHAYPYIAAIKQDVQSVMASFSSVNGEKMHGAKGLLIGLLRDEMGFDGFVIGDWNGHAEVPGCSATDCPDSLLAGVDMYMAPDSWKGLYNSLLQHAKDGTLPMARLDEAVLRILKVKIRAGLFEAGLPSARPETGRDRLGRQAHLDVAREAVRKSLVLLKNNNAALPIDARDNIVVIGAAANSIQQQTGGWTLSWQGNDNKNEEFENSETIYQGLKRVVEAAGGSVSYAARAADIKGKPDAIVFVYGEQPYAEFFGDLNDTVYEFADGPDLATLTALQKFNAPVISIFLTGRPLWMNAHLNRSDAFVVGWLPGTQGGAMAEVLAQIDQADFSGTLPFAWPSDATGTPIDKDSKEGVLFTNGYGLSYRDAPMQMARLSQEPGVADLRNQFTGAILARGGAVDPMHFYIGDSSNARVPADTFNLNSLGDAITSRGVDFKAQEDARKLTWSGKGWGTASVQSQRAIDLTLLGQADKLVMRLHYRLDEKPQSMVAMAMMCGDGCDARLDATAIFEEAEIGDWQEADIALSCFTKAGLDLRNVKAPLAMRTDAPFALSLHKVRFEAVTAAPPCPVAGK